MKTNIQVWCGVPALELQAEWDGAELRQICGPHRAAAQADQHPVSHTLHRSAGQRSVADQQRW